MSLARLLQFNYVGLHQRKCHGQNSRGDFFRPLKMAAAGLIRVTQQLVRGRIY
jgi:hypothetical protein